jgi:hypothetical protein
MNRINIADVTEVGGRVVWRPKPRFVALGFQNEDCGAVGDPACREIIIELDRRARLANRADKNARLLARADRIRAAYA